MSAAILPKEDVSAEGGACVYGVHFETGGDQSGHGDIHANDAYAFVGRKRSNVRDFDERIGVDARGWNWMVNDDCGNGKRGG